MHKVKDYLTKLGYPSSHPFFVALDRNETIDLNTPDENGFTPLRIAIQRQDETIIKALYQLEPDPKHLSDYDRAMLDEVVHHKEGAFKELLVPSHEEIICCIQALYSFDPENINNGVCFGIAQMRRRAVFAGETDLFRKRLKNIKHNLWPLIEKAMGEIEKEGIDRNQNLVGFFKNVREKLQGGLPYHIWYDLYGFLDGVTLYDSPIDFRELFVQGASLGQQVLAAENLFSARGWLLSQHVFSRCYTRATLLTYFTCLDQAFKHLPHPICFLIHTGDHAAVVDYFQGKWVLTDANRLKVGETEYDNKKLAKILLKSNSEPLIFATIPFIPRNTEESFNQVMTALKENPEWISICESITEEQTTKCNNSGYNLLYIAAELGDIGTVQQCIIAGAEIIPQEKGKPLALYAAASNGHLDIVNALIDALKSDKEKINQANIYGETPLFAAALYGYLDIVKTLIEALKDDREKINQAANDGSTPLYIAAQYGFTAIIDELLNHGADITTSMQADTQILLDVAKKQNCEEKIQQLFTEEKIGNTLPGFTPLHGAIAFGHEDTVQLLVERGATWTETTSGISPYKLAVVMNRVDLLPAKLKQQYSQLKEGMSLVRTHIDVYLQENKESSLDKEIECCIAYLTNENHFIDSGLEGLLRAIAQANTKFTTEVSFQTMLTNITQVLKGHVHEVKHTQVTLGDNSFFTGEKQPADRDDLEGAKCPKISSE